MKVFVTGAAGFVGKEVVRRLIEERFGVRVLVRKNPTDGAGKPPFPNGVEIHYGDVTQAETVTGALDGADAVIHLVGIISEVGPSNFENVHVLGTRNVIAAAQTAGVQRLIHMSALGTRPQACSRYHQTKWAAEELVRNSGLECTIFRPSLIFGPDDHFVNLFARLSRFSPFVPVIGPGNSRFEPVAVQDVGRAFVSSLSCPATVGQTLDLCGREILTFNQILDQILLVMKRRRLKWHLPLWLARWQGAFLEWFFPRVLKRAPPLNRDQVIMLQENNVGSSSKTTELLGTPRISFREGITEYLNPRG